MKKINASMRIAALTGIACTTLSVQATVTPTLTTDMQSVSDHRREIGASFDPTKSAQSISVEQLIEQARVGKEAGLFSSRAAQEAKNPQAAHLVAGWWPWPVKGAKSV